MEKVICASLSDMTMDTVQLKGQVFNEKINNTL